MTLAEMAAHLYWLLILGLFIEAMHLWQPAPQPAPVLQGSWPHHFCEPAPRARPWEVERCGFVWRPME